ncbi:putative membrane protein [Burkholderia cenocepacia]|uniref:Membrane protein n=1 Tax=Burkholderia cenocepacia TaxID=95486 RepID=A0AAN0RNB9_9BURK|nr:putative membrane protein [Burkholderia cenocepacia]
MKRLVLLWKTARGDLRVLWAVLGRSDRPGWLIPALGFVAVYALGPLNFAIPLLGVVDDAVLVPFFLHLIVLGLPTSLRNSMAR